MSKSKVLMRSCMDCAWKNNCNVRRENNGAMGCAMYVKKSSRDSVAHKLTQGAEKCKKKQKNSNTVFTKKDLTQIRFALEYLHDADLSDYGSQNVSALENVMKKLDIKFVSQL